MNRCRFCILVSSLSLIVGAALQAQESAPGGAEIKMTAKKYEFDPGVVTVKQGAHVKLVITATDRDHGFKLKAYDINQHLKKAVPTTVEFTADKAGTFPFECSDFCGLGHGRMKGKLVVELASASNNP
jgi:cytochrome c oxidase subunit II